MAFITRKRAILTIKDGILTRSLSSDLLFLGEIVVRGVIIV